MALQFSEATTAQRIEYPANTAIQNLGTRTIMFWVNMTSYGAGITHTIASLKRGTPATDEDWSIFYPSATGLRFTVSFSTFAGIWDITTSTGLKHIAITYNSGSTANDPIVYVNGASVAVTEVLAPSGTLLTGTNTNLLIGAGNNASYTPFTGQLLSFAIYNRILTATEIADAYNSRKAIPDLRGLVFAPQLIAGGAAGSGGTLAAGNTIPDMINGGLGVPNGSPLFVQDTYLNFP